MHERFLEIAVDEARRSIDNGGGPFGAVVVRDGAVLAKGNNLVTLTHDPTAHAEVVAIRAACKTIADHRLAGATLYASTEPCPLCLAASYWARIERVFYASTREDAARAGFDDAEFYRQLSLPVAGRSLQSEYVALPSAQIPLQTWVARTDTIPY
jgi:guanine deaminase